jgi:hypothetical protein
MTARRTRLAALSLISSIVLAVAGCTGTTSGEGALASGSSAPDAGQPSASATPTASPTSSVSGDGPSAPPDGCPATAIPPDPKRPTVTLSFDIADDLATVTGEESVAFTPDLPIDEIVFRLTANTTPTVDEGNGVRVTAASADHGGQAPRYEIAGAAEQSQGGLLVIPLEKTVPAGTTITAKVSFVVTLGANSFDRFGRASGYAWFASAHPLLAWERGVGWHREPMIQFTAESATTEAAQTDLTVLAPAGLSVLMSGSPAQGEPTGTRLRWHSTMDSARDVSVSVGPFALADSTVSIGGKSMALRVGAPQQATADALVPAFTRALTELAALLGPYPFPGLSVARLPGAGGGIEYPGSILMLDSSRLVVVHETAHQWFYAMVGNSQALHAWLDEALASWAEQVVNADPPAAGTLHSPGIVDTPTADYGANERDYYRVTYDKGAAALDAARTAAGADAFDAAIRCYINANAWTIADPENLEAALADLPPALDILRGAGALP